MTRLSLLARLGGLRLRPRLRHVNSARLAGLGIAPSDLAAAAVEDDRPGGGEVHVPARLREPA